ncbi:MAG: fibronectin type III domain-containing protein [Chloroflexota bacterium]|nr:fibronectin type III domain-containing protein [Chloroflexota bacterium]MDE2962264.1 fibronectin type III domain-containing protein [Chloroflexota bacterium]
MEKTYTFHVGPVAELEARDGGSGPNADAERSALTIAAVNNGPDDSPGARVTGLPRGAEVIYISQGRYDGVAGVWNIGEFMHKDSRRTAGQPEHATLVLSATAGDTADVSIANSEDYEVCIASGGGTAHATTQTACNGITGASWHSGPVYDYDTSNSTDIRITARAGAGGVGPDIPALETPSVHTPAVGVSWSEIDNLYGVPVSHYETQWSANGESPWIQLQTDLTLNELVDRTIQSGQTRYYRVRAVSEAGVAGPWSAPVVVRTGGAEVTPGAPTEVSARADGGNAIVVSWSAPADDGGFPVTGYQVRWSANGADGWRNFAALGSEATSYNDTGLAFATERYYQVRAQNDAGWGGWSATVSATTLAGVPATPNLTARANGSTAVNLSWTEPADNGSPITDYEIERSLDGSAWSPLTTTDPSVRAYTDSGLDPGTTYHYRVRAVNSAGDGSWSTVRSATTTAQMPGVPQNLAAAADGENAIIVTWDAPADDGGSAITSYRVEQRAVTASGLGSASHRTVNANAQEYRHSGLAVGSTWQYRVQARNAAGWGEWSEPVEASTLSGVPAAPGSFTARANGSKEIVLTWTEPDGRGEQVQYYRVDQSPDGSADSWSELATVSGGNTTTYIDGGLQPSTTRYYRIRARNFNGWGQWSATRSATTDASPLEAPTGLTAEADGENAITLSWTAPNAAGSAVSAYRVERSVHGEAPWELLSSSVRNTTYTDSRNLYRGMTRYYRVAARNSAGWGEWSDPVAGATAGEPAAAPGWVDNLRCTSVDSSLVSLAWNAPLDDGGAPVDGYRYQVTGPDGAERPRWTTDRSVNIGGLNAEGGYLISVWAVNAVGDGLAETLNVDPKARSCN